LILNKTKIGLKEAKDFIEKIQTGKYENLSNPITISTRERVVINKGDNEIRVIYFDDEGNEHIVIPSDVLWGKVKTLVRDNETIKEYERNFSIETKSKNQNLNTVLIQRKRNPYRVFLIVILVISILFWFYITNK
ncbi:MAG: hypothetical protein AAFQ20_02175, partial [Bacteroidota bacterium]